MAKPKKSKGLKPGPQLSLLGPAEYFQNVVTNAVTTLKVRASDHAQAYLVNLLSHFIQMEHLYPTAPDGQRQETLTEQLSSALQEESQEARRARFRKLGDFSLYIAGFFSDSLARKLVDVDYYIGMGEAAYGNVAQLEERKNEEQLFRELSKGFPGFVDVLSQVSEEAQLKRNDNKDLLRIYDLWSKTGSDRLAKKLAKAGIVTQAVGGSGTKPPKFGTGQ